MLILASLFMTFLGTLGIALFTLPVIVPIVDKFRLNYHAYLFETSFL